jgi:benzoyl-CoA reductase/2-hydroxyglutaryl-CoA dehydratase subunit BcrC/BadD/HgdB
MTEDSFEPLTDEDASARAAVAAMAADDATLRRAIAAVLDQCDALYEQGARYRQMAAGKRITGNSKLPTLLEAPAKACEGAAERLEEALMEAFGLFDVCEPEHDP